jgi:cytochrome oxidase Cu insertion factor (SCO1/SenC/PrrC family)
VKLARWAAAAWALGVWTAPAAAQQEQGPTVGQRAPDFALPAATRAGTQARPVRLRDFKGKTVVLAFFYKARTKG